MMVTDEKYRGTLSLLSLHKPLHIGDESSECCAERASPDAQCCKVDAIVAIDGRGQLVLPKEVREKAGVRAGDKFAVISYQSEGKVCCISLVKADDFAETVKGMLGPMMKEMLQ
ncbi:HgcAB-associated protein HgcC [Chloroflexota bacterium]